LRGDRRARKPLIRHGDFLLWSVPAQPQCAIYAWTAQGQLGLCRIGAAYWLLHSVRLAAPRKSRWRGATFETIRSTFVKIACRVEQLRTRIKLSFPAHLPHADDLAAITARLCAQGP